MNAIAPSAPPSLDESSTLRQRALASGLDPAYWYPVEWDKAVGPGQVREVKFWNTSVALWRTRRGTLHALENRCAHRQAKLSNGVVDDCRLSCIYHGWSYDTDGRLAEIPHERFGKARPSVTLKRYPVQVRYGMIWVFFGDPALAGSRPIPDIPEHDDWVCVSTDFVWRAHPTMIVNNVMDSTHVGMLHQRRRRTRSFIYGPVTRCEAEPDRVIVSHTIEPDRSALLNKLTNGIKVNTQDACYQYPYLWISVGGVYKLWNFMLPIDRRTTRIFMLNFSERIKVPFTPWLAPRWMSGGLAWLAKHLMVQTLFEEDGWSTEIEQEGYEQSWDTPSIDPHPAIRPSYQLTIRKWREHLERVGQAG